MILVDTSVWVDHLRRGDRALATALEAGRVATHEIVIGELACGQLKSRAEALGLLKALVRLPSATNDEALYFVEHHRLYGRGLGYVDVHLLAAAALNKGVRLWTRDKRLGAVAAEMALAHTITG